MKWSISFSEDQSLHQGIPTLHKVRMHLKSTAGWGLCSALWLLGSVQQSMETCLKVLFLGSRDSAKYRIALTASHYFDIGCCISNEVVPCSEIFLTCDCQISYLGSWSWREPSCAGSWTWKSSHSQQILASLLWYMETPWNYPVTTCQYHHDWDYRQATRWRIL